jgi:RNA polymerase sigma-70 factor (ECF subfamily)
LELVSAQLIDFLKIAGGIEDPSPAKIGERICMRPRATDHPRELEPAQLEDGPDLGPRLECHRHYLTILARIQIGRRLQGKADAADLVQETFLGAHRDFDRYRGSTEKEFTAWLRQILACKVSDLLRRYLGAQCRDVRLEQQLAEELDESSQALGQALAARQSSPSQHVVRREQAVLLADALERLPRDYSEVIILRQMENLTFPEIAVRLGRSVNSVEKLWVRGLARLRRLLGTSL